MSHKLRMFLWVLVAGLMSIGVVQAARSGVSAQKKIFSHKNLQKLLPPIPPFKGDMRMLLAKGSSMYAAWATPAERSNFKTTATYKQLYAYIRKVAKRSSRVRVVPLETAAGGYKVNLVIISKKAEDLKELAQKNFDGLDDAKNLGKTDLPTIFFESGIHPAENGGIDGGLLLLRDLVVTKKLSSFLDHVNIVWIPILNVTGHERQANYGHSRFNQRGPSNSGWRANTAGLNLNRDFSKLETKGVRASIKVLRAFKPIFWLDLHETDGMSYQNDVTWCDNGMSGYSPSTTRWLKKSFGPKMSRMLTRQGQVPGPCLTANDTADPTAGFYPYYSDGPRFSNAYGDARHVPSLLVEIHSLITNKQRIVGAYDFYVNTLKIVSSDIKTLQSRMKSDMRSRPSTVTLDWTEGPNDKIPYAFKGYELKTPMSNITGGKQVVWLAKKKTWKSWLTPTTKPLYTARRPKAYWIPAAWSNVIKILKMHGIKMRVIKRPTVKTLKYMKIQPASFKVDKPMYEGHTRVEAKKFTVITRKHTFMPGSVVVRTDQDLGTLATILLEPKAVDSFFRWGYFNTVMGNTGVVPEKYIMIPIAKMMLEDRGFKKAYGKAIKREGLKTPAQKLDWLYRQTPFYDKNAFVYPVGYER